MKIDNHIAYRFLTDDTFWFEIIETSFPQIKSIEDILTMNKEDKLYQQIINMYHGLCADNNKSYYITESVTDKLDMLKVSKNTEFPTVKNNFQVDGEKEITVGNFGDVVMDEGVIKTFDWKVFAHINRLLKDGESRKYTFIMPDNQLVRLISDNGYLSFTHITCKNADWNINHGTVGWCMFWINLKRNVACTHWAHKDVQDVEEYIFKLLCFIYLSDNEEMIIPPGAKHGTRKSGKVINSLKFPLTIVTSKWNITSIRTEGFDVSGHFRLQPYATGTKMIFIQPFRKHGYVKRAASEGEN